LSQIPGSPFPAGTGPISALVDRSGDFVYVANRASNNVSVFTLNGATGAPTQVAGSPFAAGREPFSIAVAFPK
jgi:6-phosphogluconolactonase